MDSGLCAVCNDQPSNGPNPYWTLDSCLNCDAHVCSVCMDDLRCGECECRMCPVCVKNAGRDCLCVGCDSLDQPRCNDCRVPTCMICAKAHGHDGVCDSCAGEMKRD